ncbi:MAG: hypothetical protein DRH23_01120 [Deltaproteobacteria bacterium]|nr:DUF697 domain-containing protein [Deltaproteobacteria bacterium]MBW2224491.1 DUF697 domain-containing protein [Deltaproteobacteria bacterium]MBW2545903.1 DUF697 domain-containing protein [Deltaproteobacteria bacterium]MBW2718773.1 DUF697 domain-containing protein [Deltaproteobacteria bacterium]RLB51864.1 MAG: hypothetical protein DRH23_01120 [Deltaproteobacteria bacterium]
MSNRAKEMALDQLVRVLDRVPLVSSVKNDLSGLRSLLYRRRPPRIAALGLASSGRSTLLRALIERQPIAEPLHADHGQWVHLEHEGAKLDWLEIDVDDAAARSQWHAALADERPDLVFLTFEPNDAKDTGPIIERAKSLLAGVSEGDGALRVFPLLTHADLIGRSESHVEAACHQLDAKLRDSGLTADPVRAVSSISGRGLEGLSEATILALPEEARLEAARALTRAKEGRVRIGNEIVQACTAVSVTVGLTPIPFSDMMVLGPLQAMMVSSLAYLSGRSWGKKTVAEWLGSIGVVGGVGMGLRFSAQTIAKFVPGAGNVVSAGVAGAGTTAMGQSAIKYFLKD